MSLKENIYHWGYEEDGSPKSFLILNEKTPGITTIAALDKWYMEAVDPKKAPHVHVCDETVGFVGIDWEHPEQLNGHAVVYIDGEKYESDRSFIFYAPKNVIHCPFIIERADRPLQHICMPIMVDAKTERYPEQLEGYNYAGTGKHTYEKNMITGFGWKDYQPLDGERPVVCVDASIVPGAFTQKIVWFTKALSENILEEHKAEHNEMLMFMGADPAHPDRLNARVTITVDGESASFDMTTFVYVPKGSVIQAIHIDSLTVPFLYSYGIDTQDNR